MSEGIRVASVDDIPLGEGIAISSEVTGTDDDIAIFRTPDGACFALNDTCTHEAVSLADGWVEDCWVECPLHASRFDLTNGKVLSLPATRDTVAHRVEVRDGDVFLYPNETPTAE